MLSERADLVARLLLDDKFSGALDRADRKAQSTFNRISGHAGKAAATLGRNIERGVVVATGAAVAGFGYAVHAAGDFEASLNTIATIVDRGALPKIGEDIRKISRDTGIGVDEISSAYYDLVSAGVQAADATSVLTDATHLAIGGLGTEGETVDLLTTAMNAYGLSADGVTKATDMFAKAIADGKVKASDIAASFADVAPLAKTMGVGIDQISAAYAYLSVQGTKAGEAMTQMRSALAAIMAPSKDLAKAGKVLGVNWENEVRKKGLIPALQEIADYAKKTKTPLQDLLGRKEAVLFLLQTTGTAEAGFQAELEKINASAGTATKQFAEREQGFNYQIGRLKTNLHDAAITIGSEALPALGDLAEEATGFLASHQPEIRQFSKDLAGGIREAVQWAKSLDWDAIGRGLQVAAGFAKGLIDAFMAMPDEAKGIILALGGLNKLTGGGVINIGVDLLKGAGGGLFQQFLGRGSPANPMFVVAEGGLGGFGGAAGAAGGGSFLAAGLGGAAIGAATAGGVLALGDIRSGNANQQMVGVSTLAEGSSGMIARALTSLVGDPVGDFLKSTFGVTLGNRPQDANSGAVMNVVDNSPGAREERAAAVRTAASNAEVAAHTEALNAGLNSKQERQIAAQQVANEKLRQIAAKTSSTKINIMPAELRVVTQVEGRTVRAATYHVNTYSTKVENLPTF